jgi:hypothetical protein
MKVTLRICPYFYVDIRTFRLDWRRAHKVRRYIEQRKVI